MQHRVVKVQGPGRAGSHGVSSLTQHSFRRPPQAPKSSREPKEDKLRGAGQALGRLLSRAATGWEVHRLQVLPSVRAVEIRQQPPHPRAPSRDTSCLVLLLEVMTHERGRVGRVPAALSVCRSTSQESLGKAATGSPEGHVTPSRILRCEDGGSLLPRPSGVPRLAQILL